MSQSSYSLRQLGWKNHFNQQLSIEQLESFSPRRVTQVYRNRLTLLGEDGEQDLSLAQYPTLKSSTIGDWIIVPASETDKPEQLDRFSLFSRKAPGSNSLQNIAANVDTAFIVSSCNKDFNLSRIERYLALAKEAEVTAVLVLTKVDQIDEQQQQAFKDQLVDMSHHLDVVMVNATNKESCQALLDWCNIGQTVVLLGSSGVGKTTLTNTLCSTAERTAEIREDDAKGRHTTTERSLFFTEAGGLVLDCPGMRELQLSDCEDGIKAVFDDVELLAEQCKFSDCHHEAEPGCAVQKAIKEGSLDERRLSNYKKMLTEQERNSLTLAQSHQQDRKLGKLIKSSQSAKRDRYQDQ